MSYTDLRPTYTENAEYADYVNTEIAENVFIDDRMQLRSNCYGYAMRLHCGISNISAHVEDNWDEDGYYKQQPGEFYDKTLLHKTNEVFCNELYVYEGPNGTIMTGTTVKAMSSSISSTSFTKSLQAGKRYCIKIVTYNQTLYDSEILYSLNSQRTSS